MRRCVLAPLIYAPLCPLFVDGCSRGSGARAAMGATESFSGPPQEASGGGRTLRWQGTVERTWLDDVSCATEIWLRRREEVGSCRAGCTGSTAVTTVAECAEGTRRDGDVQGWSYGHRDWAGSVPSEVSQYQYQHQERVRDAAPESQRGKVESNVGTPDTHLHSTTTQRRSTLIPPSTAAMPSSGDERAHKRSRQNVSQACVNCRQR